ncbi:hypothetical protein [uncultured Hydrogenophaga sp.]|uniref:hypothetical protein n=1 Tax=uncultured Hydrogenophaga sp. TaxID=199683 RepID=UPI00265EBA74|nr:hypothetical protein [uncultured Hydrogenophaga sp.]
MQRLLDLVLALVPVIALGYSAFALIRSILNSDKLIAVQGTLSSAKAVFDEDPGWLYFQKRQPGESDGQLVEHFQVTAVLARGITGEVVLSLPAGMSIAKLEEYSPALFERLAKGYFSVKTPFKGIPFDRSAQLALLRALTPLPQLAPCHRLVARNGRLLLEQVRLLEAVEGTMRQPKEVVIERARIALEALAAEWSAVKLPKRFMR